MYWIVLQHDQPRAAHLISTDGISHYNRMHDRVLDAGLYLPPSGYEVCFIASPMTNEMLDLAAKTLVQEIRREAHVWA
jgi:glutamate-1-semialdehyde aminotransferase